MKSPRKGKGINQGKQRIRGEREKGSKSNKVTALRRMNKVRNVS